MHWPDGLTGEDAADDLRRNRVINLLRGFFTPSSNQTARQDVYRKGRSPVTADRPMGNWSNLTRALVTILLVIMRRDSERDNSPVRSTRGFGKTASCLGASKKGGCLVSLRHLGRRRFPRRCGWPGPRRLALRETSAASRRRGHRQRSFPSG